MLVFLAAAVGFFGVMFAYLLTKPNINKGALLVVVAVVALGDAALIRALVIRLRAPKAVRLNKDPQRSVGSVRFDATVASASTGWLLPAALGCWLVAILAVVIPLQYVHSPHRWMLYLALLPTIGGWRFGLEWSRRRKLFAARKGHGQ